jgi:hypothetical protein
MVYARAHCRPIQFFRIVCSSSCLSHPQIKLSQGRTEDNDGTPLIANSLRSMIAHQSQLALLDREIIRQISPVSFRRQPHAPTPENTENDYLTAQFNATHNSVG